MGKMYTDEELTRITYSVNSRSFRERDVLATFVERKVDILSPNSFFVVVPAAFENEPSFSPFSLL